MKRLLVVAAFALAGCATVRPVAPPPAIADADLRPTIAVLASDAFVGRMSGTPGEEKTIAYLAERFRASGLESGARGPRPFLDPFEVRREPTKGPLPAGLPPGQANFTAAMNARGPFTSHNVVGIARGKRPDGRAVVVMAHWDHLGVCMPQSATDKVCNGAVDNASGIAAMLAVAERVAAMRLDRDVWFVATSAEEWGLLGAKAFAENPPLPLASIVAGFNLDTIAIASSGAPVAMVAAPGTGLDALVKEAAAAVGRSWDGDDEAAPFLKRQDGWALAGKGVPMIMAGGSFSNMDLLKRFLAGSYHAANDELRPETDLGGAVDDANLHVELIRRAASRDFKPTPKAKSR